MHFRVAYCLLILSLGLRLEAAEVKLGNQTFTVPDGFTIEEVAGPPLVDRPIGAAFDELGRLYVTDSSGSNDKVEKQLEDKPHRIVRLEDTDGDGVFDERVVFADKMMFPEGAMWYDGSLYVAAPPSIWKLTDTDGDGVADKREEWFQGKTLTGCANDLHGPYLGPDGWIYWCKGAFAEQTHPRPGRSPLVTRAAHVFRRHPQGEYVEAVMTGGMDNPVDVVFTPGGERLFTTTFLQQPSGGRRDGIIHAIYGGVYGKDHGVLEGHPRTGELMPPLVHLGAAAPSGLTRVESRQFGTGYENNVFACLFNMRKVTRHVLQSHDATFSTTDFDFVVSDNVDFHPTDIIEDADGSLLIVDTGGWYKLCCPTSHLWKPDVLGAIYRVSRTGSHQVDDPRGRAIDWSASSPVALCRLLADVRPAVRERARQELAGRGPDAVPALTQASEEADSKRRRSAVWALTRIDSPAARKAVRNRLNDEDSLVRHAALTSVSLHRDVEAFRQLVAQVQQGQPPHRRVAAEALGRLGRAEAVPALLEAAANTPGRALEHSIRFALIELADPERTRLALQDDRPAVISAGLMALDQMVHSQSGGVLIAGDVVRLLDEPGQLGKTAWWISKQHSEWASELQEFFRAAIRDHESKEARAMLQTQLPHFLQQPAAQQLLAEEFERCESKEMRLILLEVMRASGVQSAPSVWQQVLAVSLRSRDPELVEQAIACISAFSKTKFDASIQQELQRVAATDGASELTRLRAVLGQPKVILEPKTARFLLSQIHRDQFPQRRSLACDALLKHTLGPEPLQLVASVPELSSMELIRLLPLFRSTGERAFGLKLVAALRESPAALSLAPEKLRESLDHFDEEVQGHLQPLLQQIARENDAKLTKLESILKLMDQADVRRGHQVFNSAKASCRACHEIGYLGGNTGPDLTSIGRIRSERDLLESILFPSASFVRSYEPVEIVTADGRILNGVIKNETSSELTLALDAQKTIRLRTDEIDERRPGQTSIMPAGLEKQLTAQELADLVKYLKDAN